MERLDFRESNGCFQQNLVQHVTQPFFAKIKIVLLVAKHKKENFFSCYSTNKDTLRKDLKRQISVA